MIMDDQILANYLEALAIRLKTADKPIANAHGLQHIHMQIFGYLGRCNAYSDTFLMLTEYLGQTRGTVSKSVDKLQDKGYLAKNTDPNDKRKIHLTLTPKGRAIYNEQRALWSSVGAGLEREEQEQIHQSLRTVIRQFQRMNENRNFGTCRTCRYYITGDAEDCCQLTGAALTPQEIDLICAFHGDD